MGLGHLTHGDHGRVLLVEDDLSTAEMYRMGLELSGYSVSIAGDGAIALLLAIDDGNFDIVVLDLGLPRLDGLFVLKAFREAGFTPGVPVLVLSNRTEDFPKALAEGAVQCMNKSRTSPGDLAERIGTLANQYLKGA